MKKLFGFLILTFMGIGISHAELFDYTAQKEFTITYSTQMPTAIINSGPLMLIKLSSTTIWPHKEAGAVHITSIQTELDKAATSTTTIKIGVINYLGASTGSVTWFSIQRTELNVSNTGNILQEWYPNMGIYAKVIAPVAADTDGLTPYILSTEKSSGSSSYKLGTAVPTILGTTVMPALGDIVMEITKGGVAINYNIRVKYYSEK